MVTYMVNFCYFDFFPNVVYSIDTFPFKILQFLHLMYIQYTHLPKTNNK